MLAIISAGAAARLFDNPDAIVRAQLALRGHPFAGFTPSVNAPSDFPVGVVVWKLFCVDGKYAGYVDSTGSVVMAHGIPYRFPMSMEVDAVLFLIQATCVVAIPTYIGAWVHSGRQTRGFPMGKTEHAAEQA